MSFDSEKKYISYSNDIKEWILENQSKKIQNIQSRNPFISEVRKHCDKLVVDINKSTVLNNNENKISISVFSVDKEIKHISRLDYAEYNLFKYYSNFKTKLISVRNKYFYLKDKYFMPIIKNINENYEKINTNSKKRNFLLFFVHKLKFLPKIKNLNFVKNYTEEHDELTKQIYQIEKANIVINHKLLFNRIANFWRIALLIKPNYLIEVNQKAPTLNTHYDSIFYKIYKICKTKVNMKFSKIKLNYGKFLLLLGLVYFTNMRYSLYSEENLNSLKIDEEKTKFLFKFPDKVEKLFEIYDKKTDEMFFDIYKKEFQLTKDFNNFNDEELKYDMTNKYFIGKMQIYFIILGFLLVYSIRFYFTNKKKFSLKSDFSRIILLFFMLNELNYYLSLNTYMTCRMIPSERKLTIEDRILLLKYNFYRDNMINCYLIKNI